MHISSDNNKEVKKIYEDIEEFIKLLKHKNNLNTIGDWYIVIGEGSNGKEAGKYGSGKRNKRED